MTHSFSELVDSELNTSTAAFADSAPDHDFPPTLQPSQKADIDE